MAERKPKNTFKEPNCPLCSQYFEDAVTIECGHSFCRSCISQQWKNMKRNVTCPECKDIPVIEEKEFRPNKRLSDTVRVYKQLDDILLRMKAERKCDQHQKPFLFFCEDDELPICSTCRKAEVHQSHDVTKLLTTVHSYMEDIHEELLPLKWHLEDLLISKSKQKKCFEELKRKAEIQKQKIVSEFKELHQLLDKEKDTLLLKLTLTTQDIRKRMEENMARLEDQCSSLNKVISEIEETLNGSPLNLLKEVENLLDRCDTVTFQEPQVYSTECDQNFYSAPRQYIALKQVMKRFQVEPAKFSLDSQTVNFNLILSEDQKSVKWTKEVQSWKRNKKRFDTIPCVLGNEGFSSGRYFWVVDVDVKGTWALGIAKNWVCREGNIRLAPSCGIWALRHMMGQYFLLTSPAVKLFLKDKPKQIRAYLDMEIRQLSLYNSDSKEHIHTFNLSSSKTFFPFFWTMCEAEIRLLSC